MKSEFRILVIEDENDQKEQFEEAIKEINQDDELSFTVLHKVVNSLDMARATLYSQTFDALIVDLKLQADDGISNQPMSGNLLLKEIKNKEIIPTVVRTGFPGKIDEGVDQGIVHVYSKDTPEIRTIILNLWSLCSSPLYKLFGPNGEFTQDVQKLFWEILPESFSQRVAKIDASKQKKVLMRYVSNWLINKNMFDETYDNVDPIEMYMFPNFINQVCTCDIFRNKNEDKLYVVITPACDLANRKVDCVVMCEIIKHESVEDFVKELEKIKSAPQDPPSRAIDNLQKWSRNANSKSLRYHFLPKVDFFEGGFIDFRLVQYFAYDPNTGQLKDHSLEKIGTITEAFKRDIVARFASYYHRQGQPEFDSQSMIRNMITSK